MTQVQKRKPRPAGDEGAVYTAAVMAEVKRRRLAKTPVWTAERLAAEMTAVGVPWTRDSVVNLERGRRKRLAAHELLALAYVLEASPVDLLAPLPGTDRMVPATPNRLVMATQLRAWCDRQFESLRYLLEEEGQHVAHADFDVEAYMVDALKDGRLTVEGIDDILRFMREARKRMVRDGHWGTDGQD